MASDSEDVVQPDRMVGYELPVYDYVTPEDLRTGAEPVHPVVIVGAGVSGLTLAVDLGQRGIPVVLLDEDITVGAAGLSSRGICYAQRTLEILDRFGLAARVVGKGTTWRDGRVYLGQKEVYRFNLQPEPDQKFPAFVNLQQFYVEEYLVDAIAGLDSVDLRWRHRVEDVAIERDDQGQLAVLSVATPDGSYRVRARWLIASDGGRSTLRQALAVEDESRTFFEDQWCIADIRMERDGEPERRFWMDSDFADGGAAILHRMADNVWRTDFQIGHYDDPAAEATPAKARQRLAAMLPGQDFELVWVGPWRFKNRLIGDFVHEPVIFVGDSAHELPPFGARGGNGGMQDADNLGWKLALVLAGAADPGLIRSYHDERHAAARENIHIASRSALFVCPETKGQKLIRDAALALADSIERARPMVNTGRLSVPNHYGQSPLNAPDDGAFDGGRGPGSPMADGRLTNAEGGEVFAVDLRGPGFTVFAFLPEGWNGPDLPDLGPVPIDLRLIEFADRPSGPDRYADPAGHLAARFGLGAEPGLVVLRPDGHVLARSRRLERAAIEAALARVLRAGADADRISA